jgi:thermitase
LSLGSIQTREPFVGRATSVLDAVGTLRTVFIIKEVGMATKPRKAKIERKFRHPTAGNVQQDARYLAIRWKTGASGDAKAALLRRNNLSLAKITGAAERPLPQVNQTDGLSWVELKGAKSGIDEDAIASLEGSDLIEWVSVAFQGQRSKDHGSGLFAINPTRFYIAQQALDRAGSIAQLGADLAVDTERASRIPGWIAVRVEDASTARGHTAIEAARTAEAGVKATAGPALVDIVHFENIPFFSPTCQVGRCRVPMGEFTPDDPMFAQQWGLHRVEIPRAWEIVRGSSDVTVAVIDEGVELAHPDLNMHPVSWNASNDTFDGNPTGNHGTACAGIIGAQFDNSQGVAGAASGVRIMAIATATWADVDIAEGLYFAADNGANVISMSFGVYDSWGMWDFSLIRDALQHAHDQGLVLIAASGNENGSIARFPGSDSRTLCVGGSNRSDERKRISDGSSESWWGASFGPDVDVVAPCLEMPTTDRLGNSGYSTGDYFDSFNGTSSATPLVAGLAGLILSLRPTLTNVEVRDFIESTCDKISPSLYTYAHDNAKPSGTWNNEVGYGRVNAERAILKACATDHEGEEECSGCSSECITETPTECRGPKPVPWLPHDRCMYFYESRNFDSGILQDRLRLQIRIDYQHCLKLVGRQQGPLLYTTTLLPGEKVRIYEYDRYRRVRSETQRMSVYTSFRQTVSAMSQSRFATSTSAYADFLNTTRASTDSSASVGGGLAGFLGLPQGKTEFSADSETTIASGASVRTASESFTRFAIAASQAMEAERSTVISTFEDEEHRSATVRTLKNHNSCYAVTYFVRRVNEAYESSSRIVGIEWRLGDSPWRSLEDVEGVPDGLRKLFDVLMRHLPKEGDVTLDKRPVTIPTDGTLYETELAHCSSCEPVRSAGEVVQLELQRSAARKACLEAELLALELERRRRLAEMGDSVPLETETWPFMTEVVPSGNEPESDQ